MFESLGWDEKEGKPKIEMMETGTFLTIVDAHERWTYIGSLTTPPCSTKVQWNVVKQVYPIKEKHLKLFQDQLGRQEKYDLVEKGNFRNV